MLRGVVINSAKASWIPAKKHALSIAHRCVQFLTEMAVEEVPNVVKPQKYARKPLPNELTALELSESILSANFSNASSASATLNDLKLHKSKDKVIRAMKEARKNGTKLEFQEYLQGFSACMNVHQPWAIELSFYVFQQMTDNHYKVPIVVFEKLAIRIRQHDQLVAIDRGFRNLGHRPSEQFIKHMLISISEAHPASMILHKLLLEYYELYLVMQRARSSFRLDASVYIAISSFFCNLHDSTAALRVLQNMVDVHYEITTERCERLFTTALIRREAAVLRVLSRIYLDKAMPSSALDLGELRRLMQIACALGDDQLALLGFQLLQRSGVQLTFIDYFCLVQSMLKSHDLISAVELLQEMQDNGFILDTKGEYAGLYHDILVEIMKIFRKGGVSTPTPSAAERESSQGQQGNDIDHYNYNSQEEDFPPPSSSSNWSPEAKSKRRKFINDFYSALVDQAQHPDAKPIPRIILDAILIVTSEDFSTTREQCLSLLENYSTVFRQDPSPLSYVALLKSIVHRRQILPSDQEDIFNVFQDFESRFMFTQQNQFDLDLVILAMSKCYDLLYLSMLNKRTDFAIFEDIWNHMLSEHDKVLPSLSVCRRLLIHFTQTNDEEKAGLVLQALGKLYYDKYKVTTLPKYLMDQMQTYLDANLGLEPTQEQSQDNSAAESKQTVDEQAHPADNIEASEINNEDESQQGTFTKVL